jgi:hypothetical protein
MIGVLCRSVAAKCGGCVRPTSSISFRIIMGQDRACPSNFFDGGTTGACTERSRMCVVPLILQPGRQRPSLQVTCEQSRYHQTNLSFRAESRNLSPFSDVTCARSRCCQTRCI